MNGLCGSSRASTPRPGVLCGSVVSTMRILVWELVCIKVLSFAHCSSFWCWRCCRVNSALVYHGSSSTLMTWCSSWTPNCDQEECISKLKCGRLAWKVNGSVLTWRRSSWSLVMIRMSSRNLASASVLSPVVVTAETPSCAHSACCGSTRHAVA